MGATQLCSVDGSTLFNYQDAISERWTEHINSVLNHTSAVSDDAIKGLPEIECNVQLDEFPTGMETKKTIRHLTFDKAPGANAISTENYYAGGLLTAWKLTELFQC